MSGTRPIKKISRSSLTSLKATLPTWWRRITSVCWTWTRHTRPSSKTRVKPTELSFKRRSRDTTLKLSNSNKKVSASWRRLSLNMWQLFVSRRTRELSSRWKLLTRARLRSCNREIKHKLRSWRKSRTRWLKKCKVIKRRNFRSKLKSIRLRSRSSTPVTLNSKSHKKLHLTTK